MSRAGYIWIVQNLDGTLRAAFTVKYECRHYLDRPANQDVPVNVSRLRDSHHHPEQEPVLLDPATLEPWPTDPEGNTE